MNWFNAFLGNLSGKPTHYVLLILGAILAIIAFAQLPLENADYLQSETVWESIALGVISAVLIGFSFYLIAKEDRIKKRISNKEKEIDSLKNDLLDRDERIESLSRDLLNKKEDIHSLNQSISRAIGFINENKNESNRVFLDKVSKIFEEISLEFYQHSSDFGARIDSADWVRQRIDKWCSEATLESHSQYGVSHENEHVFRDELKKHLKLLCENIQESKNSAPLLAQPPVPQTVGSYKLYEKAIRDVEEKALVELESEKSLSTQSIKMLRTSLSNFIELIKYSS